MEALLLIIFGLGYAGIAFEHWTKVDKLVPALIMFALMWAVIALGRLEVFEIHHGLVLSHIDEVLLHHLGKTAEIIVFLLGAMTIVEITDHFNGFGSIKGFIRTTEKKKLLWIIGALAFILSAVIDNLTATIVLITILKKLIAKKEDRWWFACMIVICANAGGAWSPIGDLTTTMLWMGNKVSAWGLVTKLFLPSVVCMVVPTFIAAKWLPAFKGHITTPESKDEERIASLGMLILGLGSILFVPIFKTVTHLPPYVGMMLSLSVVIIVAEVKSNREFRMSTVMTRNSALHTALSKLEMPSILFFLGILMAVAALESVGQLYHFAESLNSTIPNTNIVIILFGISSAIIDNVPLVAAAMGMFQYDIDHEVWHFLAYCAGTGGSMLIIGSAAGVVAMGLEKIDFMEYVKKISWLAAVGFIAGAGTFLAFN